MIFNKLLAILPFVKKRLVYKSSEFLGKEKEYDETNQIYELV